MLDLRATRGTERAFAAVLKGCRGIGIVHRLHAAHDADRVAVIEDGCLAELGSHDERFKANVPWASLWQSWHGAKLPLDEIRCRIGDSRW